MASIRSSLKIFRIPQSPRFLLAGVVKPFRTLAQTRTPDGSQFTLQEHDGDYFIKLNGRQLMSTTSTTSELLLAQLPCDGLRGRADTCVLIGGLGLGFSLQRTLELVGRHARVQIAELLPEVVAWNRELLRGVNGQLLEDKRVEVITADVFHVIRRAGPAAYDAIMLDVDNGPTSMVQPGNARIYKRRGLTAIAQALKKGGKVAFWSAVPEPDFLHDLERAGFKAEAHPAKAHDRAKRFAHMIYLAERRADPPGVIPPKRRS
jgi:spermidine synthase